MPRNEESSEWFEKAIVVAQEVGGVTELRELMSQHHVSHEQSAADGASGLVDRPHLSRAFRLNVLMNLLPKIKHPELPSQQARSFIEAAGPLLTQMCHDVNQLNTLFQDESSQAPEPLRNAIKQNKKALREVLKSHEALLAEIQEGASANVIQLHWNDFQQLLSGLKSLLALLPQQTQETDLVKISQSILSYATQLLEPALQFSTTEDKARTDLAEAMSDRTELTTTRSLPSTNIEEWKQKFDNNTKELAVRETALAELSAERLQINANFAKQFAAFTAQTNAWADLLSLGGQQNLSEDVTQSSQTSQAVVSHLGTLIGLTPPSSSTNEASSNSLQQALTLSRAALPLLRGAGQGTMAGATALLASMGPWVPALGLGAAAVGVLSYINYKQHKHTRTVVEQHALALSKQIHQVGEFMDGRFNQMESILDVSVKLMDQRFQHLQGLMTVGVTHLDKRITGLQQLIGAACQHNDMRFDRLESILNIYHQYTDSRFERLEALQGLAIEYQTLRFDSLETLLYGLDKHMVSRFRYLETLMVGTQRAAFKNLVSLKDKADQILSDVSSLRRQLSQFKNQVDKSLEELILQPYKMARHDFYYNLQDGKLSQEKYIHIMTLIDGVITSHAKSDLVAGEAVKDISELSAALDSHGGLVEYHINTMAKFAGCEHSVLVNPLIWANAARTLIDVMLHNSQLMISPQHVRTMDNLVHEGEQVQDALIKMKKGPLLQELLKQYHNKLLEVTAVVKQRLLSISYPESIQQESMLVTLQTCRELVAQFTTIDVNTHWQQHVLDIRKYMVKQQYQRMTQKLDSVTQTVESMLSTECRAAQPDSSINAAESLLQDMNVSPADPMHAFYQNHLGEDFVKGVHSSLLNDLSHPESAFCQAVTALDQTAHVLQGYLSMLFKDAWSPTNPTLKQLYEKHVWNKSKFINYFNDPQQSTQLICFPLQAWGWTSRPLRAWVEQHQARCKRYEQANDKARAAGDPLISAVHEHLQQCRSLVDAVVQEQRLQASSSPSEPSAVAAAAFTPSPVNFQSEGAAVQATPTCNMREASTEPEQATAEESVSELLC